MALDDSKVPYQQMTDKVSNAKGPEFSCPYAVCHADVGIKTHNGVPVTSGYHWKCKAASNQQGEECPKWEKKGGLAYHKADGWCYGAPCDKDTSYCSSGKAVVASEKMAWENKNGYTKGDCVKVPKSNGGEAHESDMNMYPGRRYGHHEYNDRMSSQQAFSGYGDGYGNAYDAGYYYRAAQPQQYLYGAADAGSPYSIAILLPILLMVVCCVGIICACFGVVSGWFCYFVAKGNNEHSNHSKYSRVEPYNDQEV